MFAAFCICCVKVAEGSRTDSVRVAPLRVLRLIGSAIRVEGRHRPETRRIRARKDAQNVAGGGVSTRRCKLESPFRHGRKKVNTFNSAAYLACRLQRLPATN